MTSIRNLFRPKALPDGQSQASMSFASSFGNDESISDSIGDSFRVVDDDGRPFSAKDVFTRARQMVIEVPTQSHESSLRSLGSNGSHSLMLMASTAVSQSIVGTKIDGMQSFEELNAAASYNNKKRNLEKELVRVYENGRLSRRQYHRTENALLRKKNGFTRSLWMKQQNHKRNPLAGMKECKNHMFRVSLPCHDTSNATLTQEAKLLKAEHNCKMYLHQLEMLDIQQADIANFFLKEVMPKARLDQQESTKFLKAKVELATRQRDDFVEAYEKHMMVQRKVIAKLKLKEMEENSDEEEISIDSTEIEAIKLAAGETPIFESTQLRRSAELRIEAKFGSLQERRAKRRIRDEVVNNTLKTVESIEKSSLERAQNVTGEVETLLASIKMNVEALTTSDDSDSSLDRDEKGERTRTSDPVPSTPDTVETSFVEEDREEDIEHSSDSELENNRGAEENGNTLPRTNGKQRKKKSPSPKSNAELSARLEALRANRNFAPRTSQRNGSSRPGANANTTTTTTTTNNNNSTNKSPGGAGTRRADLLQRARSARSARFVQGKDIETEVADGRHMAQIQEHVNQKEEKPGSSRRVSDARLAELRARRRKSRTIAVPEQG